MKLSVKVHPKARQCRIVRHADKEFEVWVREAPDKGKANEAVVLALSEYLGVPKSRFTLVSGEISRHKIIQVS